MPREIQVLVQSVLTDEQKKEQKKKGCYLYIFEISCTQPPGDIAHEDEMMRAGARVTPKLVDLRFDGGPRCFDVWITPR